MTTALRTLTLTLALAGLPVAAVAEAIHTPAPDFTLASREGGNVRLEDHRGEVVMVNFWASWCGPCRQEMPLMNALYHKYRDLGVHHPGGERGRGPAAAQRFLDAVPVDYPILYDPDSTVSERYEVQAMPTTVMVDRDGNARYVHYGYQPGYEDAYEQQIRELVRE